jgi:hypothetical protein
MRYTPRFYTTADGVQPVVDFLDELRSSQPILHKLVVAGIAKLEDSQRHGPPLTELVDPDELIFELRVGRANIARVFFFLHGQELVLTNGYVKQRRQLDRRELARARRYKLDWESRR